MQNYTESFRLAMARTNDLAGRMSNYPLEINTDVAINEASVVAAIAKDFAEFLPNTDVLPGKCFRVARELSYVLFELGIRHAVTVGDVALVDGLYAGVALDKVQSDLVKGYQLDFVDGRPVGRPIDAHAWITLENGCVIDATVLASQHRKSLNASEPLSFQDAIYYTGKPNTPVIQHVPMLTGLVYHQKVLTAPMDGDFQNYCQWYEDYPRLMGRLDLLRLVPDIASG